MITHSYILAIDTSCDDTAAAVTDGCTIFSNVVASQTELHTHYGGVFPTVAKQAHRENIDPVLSLALKRAHIDPKDLAAVAVTQGPGLAPALEVGITKARELATAWDKPLIAINHIEAHALSALAQPSSRTRELTATTCLPKPNTLSIVVSGGHTEFILIKTIGEYERLGWTIDDAAGEALDKVGRMLGLGYPAGPVIEQFARLGDERAFEFPLPMTTSGDYNLSFSGLKTFARNLLERLRADGPLSQQQIYDLSASFQYAICRSITYKLNKIVKTHEISEVLLGGGVAANVYLRRKLRETLRPHKLSLRVPYTKRICSDNAGMIGVVAGYKYQRGEFVDLAQGLERVPRLTV